MSAKQARDNFTDLLGAVYYGQETVIVEKKGRPFAVVVNPDEYKKYQKIAKEEFFETAEKVQKRNRGFSEEEVLKDVTKVVEEVRQAQYDNKKK